MIDTETERLLTLTQAAKRLPGRPNISTLWRWRTVGVRHVKLETTMVGGRRFTSIEALARFRERVTEAADRQPMPSRSNRQRDAETRRTKKMLREAGLIDENLQSDAAKNASHG